MKALLNRRNFRLLARILFLAWLLFVISNSMRTATVSGDQSSRICKLINLIFHTDLGDAFIRKSAHVFEYFVFGVLGTCSVIPDKGSIGSRPHAVLLLVLLIAISDETVQLFWDGRSGEVRDVWIDFGGILLGVLLTAICYRFWDRHIGKKKHGDQSTALRN